MALCDGFPTLANQIVFEDSPPQPEIPHTSALHLNGDIIRSKEILEPVLALLFTSYFDFLLLIGAEAGDLGLDELPEHDVKTI